ncbi:hypothetical protein [Deinococcus marmoris]|uniref:hypothetical protein n=1 Tax=Deinococcus marmoris TaxID=249408 RepID=UPI00054D3E67|nr:hypothetical protein [Deinococcus marmoris]
MTASLSVGPRVSDLSPGEDARTTAAQSVLTLTRLVISAPDLASGVTPTLEHLVTHTAAVGSAYFQVSGAQALTYQVRAAWGQMPQTPGMQHIAAHGLPADTPLMRALVSSARPLFFDATVANLTCPSRPQAGPGKPGGHVGIETEDDGFHDGVPVSDVMHANAPHLWAEDLADGPHSSW